MNELFFHKTKESDVDAIVSIENDNENSAFIFPNSKEEHINLISDKDVEHLILKSSDNKIVGFVILAGLENKNRSIEFRRIVINQKGRGYGRKVIKEIKRHCFEELNCHRLWLDVLETNERAKHLYLSEGFKEEEKLRDCLLIDNEFTSLIIMSIIETEYRNTASQRKL